MLRVSCWQQRRRCVGALVWSYAMLLLLLVVLCALLVLLTLLDGLPVEGVFIT